MRHPKDIKIYPVGAVVAGARYYESRNGQCLEYDIAEGSLRSVGAPLTVASGGLVGFALETEEVTPAIQRARWVASDGAEVVEQNLYVDTVAKRGCSVMTIGAPDAGAAGRCVPTRRAVHRGVSGPFAETTCTTPAAQYELSVACAAPEIALHRRVLPAPVNCASFYFTLASIGAQVDGGFVNAGPNCVADPSTATYWSLGAEIDPTTLVEASPALVGDGRIRAQALHSSGVRLSEGVPFDTASGRVPAEAHRQGLVLPLGRAVRLRAGAWRRSSSWVTTSWARTRSASSWVSVGSRRTRSITHSVPIACPVGLTGVEPGPRRAGSDRCQRRQRKRREGPRTPFV